MRVLSRRVRWTCAVLLAWTCQAQESPEVSFDGTPLALEPARHSAFPLNQVWPGYERPLSQSKEDFFVRFDLPNAGRLRVTLPDGCAAAEVRLRPLGSEGLLVDGRTASFDIARPGQFVLEMGENRPQLHIFADAPFVHRAVPDEIYFAPGVHDAGLICPTNGQTVCLAPGATVYGALLLENVTNVTVTGRGILDSSKIVRTSADGRHLRTLRREDRSALRDVTQFMCAGCENIRVEGVVLRDSPFWAMVFRGGCRNVTVDGVKIVGQWRYNSDGIDICGCENVRVRNCFVRSFDDCFVVRDGGRGADGRNLASRDVVCENSVLWCDWGFNAKAQLTGAPDALIEGVVVTNCVFANVDSGGVILAARPGGRNGIVRNVRVEDIEYDFAERRYCHQMQRRDRPDEAFAFRPVQTAKLFEIRNYGYKPSDVGNIELLFDRIAFRRIRAKGPYSHLKAEVRLKAARECVRDLVVEDVPDRVVWTREATIVNRGDARFRSEEEYLRQKFREDVTDSGTGLGLAQLKAEAAKLAEELKDREPWCLVKARLFEMICDKMAVGVSEYDYFPAVAVWSRKDRALTPVINARIEEILARDCAEARRKAKLVPQSVLRLDYDHATPDWDTALRLGFVGLKSRLEAVEEKNDFHRAMLIAADALLRNVRRLADHAKVGSVCAGPRIKMEAEALDWLCKGAPRTAYEALLFQWLFFIYGEHVDHLQVRTLGNWDRLIGPYYERDVARGILTREEFKRMTRHFWWQWGSINNWWGQPVYIGGTRADGSTEYNEVSRIVLEVQDELALPTPKLQMKIADNTPQDVFLKGLDLARNMRSVVFCCEKTMEEGLLSMGCTPEEARCCELWGCYEYQPRALANTTLPCLLNVVHPISSLLENARKGVFRPATFDDFLAAYRASLRYRSGIAMEVVCAYERPMDDMIPALIHSMTLDSCVRDGKNAIGDGMKYNYSMFLPVGAGTAADALAAVKTIVYDRQEISLRDLGALMAENWKGREDLRLKMSASLQKWGNDDPLANTLFNDIYETVGRCVNGKPNSRKGTFIVAGHSIDFFRILSRNAPATPDGRRFGDEFSKNISPAPGADKEGVTALVNSVEAVDFSNLPGDAAFDVMLHPSTVSGGKGLELMRAIVGEYFKNGGRAIHFNVLSPETLRDAQRHPERYENLQVRVCGWNVLWNSLSPYEQEAYILRAESVKE